MITRIFVLNQDTQLMAMILMSAIQYQIFVATEDALTHWVLIDVSVTRVTRLIMVEPVVLM
jgi:hypothetical protein